MTEVWSLSQMHYRLEYEHLTYQDASELLESIVKSNKYSSFDDFFYTVLKDHSLCLRTLYRCHTENPRLKINFIRENLPPYCRMYIRAPSDPDSINILRLHLLLYEIIPEDSQTSTCQPLLYSCSSDGAIADMSHTDTPRPNEEIPELLYHNLKLLYTCFCSGWLPH